MKVGSTYPTSITLNLIDHVAINIVQSLKDQFSRLIKRWLSPGYVASWIGLTFCGVLFVALWGLFRVTNLQEQQSAQKDEMNNAIQLATSLEMELRSQTESWKNLLLRGTEPDLFDKYLREFESYETSIQTGLKKLLSDGHFLEYSTHDLRLLIQEHYDISVSAIDIAGGLVPGDRSGFDEADKATFDFGRVPAQRFAMVHDAVRKRAHVVEAEAKLEMEAVATQVTLFSLLSVAVGIVLSGFFIIDRSRKEKALWYAKTAAENANRAKDSFLANISHEIRTPMNAIVGLSEVLSDTQLSPDQEEYVSTIRQSGSDLLGIINEILDLSKMEAGKFEIRPVSFRLQSCVEDAMDVIEPKAVEKGIGFSFHLDPNLPQYITADEMRVRQILINLLGNAVKFTDEGRVELKLDGDTNDDGEYVLNILVSDTGGGIRPEDQEKLFKAFSQVDDSNARRFGGTGLGLTISRDLCRLMGGDISVESEWGDGTTFAVTIVPESVSKEVISSEPLDLSAIEGKTVAVVDSSEFSRQEMEKFLTRWGADTQTWGTAQEFLEHLERGSIWNLVILGTNLKDIPCDPFARQLRLDCGKQVNAVLKWAPYEGLRIDAKPPDFNGLVYKPIQTKPLVRKMTAVLTDETLQGYLKLDSSAEMKAHVGDLRPMSILVVDDNKVNLRVAELMLKNHGYEPRLVSSGAEALETLDKEPFDVVFMDMQMPVMDGIEACKQIRDRFGAVDRPWIVALTANAMSDHKDQCLAAGMNDFISKPIKSEALQRIIQNVPLDISRPPFSVRKDKRKLSLKGTKPPIHPTA